MRPESGHRIWSATMNRHAIPACLLSALLGAAAVATVAPVEAGSAINRCVDGAGRVTLTDQACDAHTVSSTVAVPGTPDTDTDTYTYAAAPATLYSNPAPPRINAAPRPARWLPTAAPYAALAGDMATMKEARMRMLQDAASRTRLASLER
jgi:hypothetical protein